jgi:hypothetical protein
MTSYVISELKDTIKNMGKWAKKGFSIATQFPRIIYKDPYERS